LENQENYLAVNTAHNMALRHGYYNIHPCYYKCANRWFSYAKI